MTEDRETRSTLQVLEDHLQKRMEGDVEGDIDTNYAQDVVLLTAAGKRIGTEGVRIFSNSQQACTPSLRDRP